MTTENITTELAPNTPEQVAEDFVKENTTSTIVEEFVNNYKTIESLKTRVQAEANNADHYRQLFKRKLEIVEEFLKSHIGENDSASVDELKELAESLDIELTKEVEVTFTIEVTATLTVPLDFDEDDLSDSDFDTRVTYEGGHNDVECDDVEWNINDFETDEK
jgi:seryl-tRNA synthetase